MTAGLGRKFWVIAEGYIPGASTGPAPEMTSHETEKMQLRMTAQL